MGSLNSVGRVGSGRVRSGQIHPPNTRPIPVQCLSTTCTGPLTLQKGWVGSFNIKSHSIFLICRGLPHHTSRNIIKINMAPVNTPLAALPSTVLSPQRHVWMFLFISIYCSSLSPCIDPLYFYLYFHALIFSISMYLFSLFSCADPLCLYDHFHVLFLFISILSSMCCSSLFPCFFPCIVDLYFHVLPLVISIFISMYILFLSISIVVSTYWFSLFPSLFPYIDPLYLDPLYYLYVLIPFISM